MITRAAFTLSALIETPSFSKIICLLWINFIGITIQVCKVCIYKLNFCACLQIVFRYLVDNFKNIFFIGFKLHQSDILRSLLSNPLMLIMVWVYTRFELYVLLNFQLVPKATTCADTPY